MNQIKGTFRVKRDTTANWNAHPDFIPAQGRVIIYTDHGAIKDESGKTTLVPGIKIGDGKAYLIDLPFVGDAMRDDLLKRIEYHVNDSAVHITDEEREFWNNKVSCSINGERLELKTD